MDKIKSAIGYDVNYNQIIPVLSEFQNEIIIIYLILLD